MKQKRIFYEDDGRIKLIKGKILEDTEFTLKIKGSRDGDEIIIGKRFLVKIEEEKGWN